MDQREMRGMAIAATCRLKRADDGTWLVPSQSANERLYHVDLEAKSCTCLDHVDGGNVCKHYHAATYCYRRDFLPDGTVVETKSVTLTERKVYKQCWKSLYRAQTTERHRFQSLLFDL